MAAVYSRKLQLGARDTGDLESLNGFVAIAMGFKSIGKGKEVETAPSEYMAETILGKQRN